MQIRDNNGLTEVALTNSEISKHFSGMLTEKIGEPVDVNLVRDSDFPVLYLDAAEDTTEKVQEKLEQEGYPLDFLFSGSTVFRLMGELFELDSQTISTSMQLLIPKDPAVEMFMVLVPLEKDHFTLIRDKVALFNDED